MMTDESQGSSQKEKIRHKWVGVVWEEFVTTSCQSLHQGIYMGVAMLINFAERAWGEH